jgi:preprotein translocase subunit SecE
MNRQMKRMQEKAERRQKRSASERPTAPAAAARRAQMQEKRKRTSTRQFLKEVRLELKKVDWPSRQELVSYSVVVLVTVVVVTSIVAAFDSVFSQLMLKLMGA